MTPPAMATNITDTNLLVDVHGVGGLSFDELRELPMDMQLGLDLSALD